MPLLVTLVSIAIGYLLGSIPFGYLAGLIAKIDIRQHGSGNIGATNVMRVLGRPWGCSVFALDFGKGAAAVLIAPMLNFGPTMLSSDLTRMLAAIAAVLGHVFPVWLRFRGGKAVATSLGVVCALAPFSALIVAIMWSVVFLLTRYVSIASLAAAIALPMVTALMEFRERQINPPLLIFFTVLAVLICVRHRSNITRLIAGTEPRFSRR
jgi:acyl phosphate:glycerol-3-phosphate acyltransferase